MACSRPSRLLGLLQAKQAGLDLHVQSLQQLSNGAAVPYQETLRVVSHEGSRAPRQVYKQSQKHPSCSRNDLGGMFTS